MNAFKSGQYSAAADDFKTAIDLDPDFPVARLYLATAYMQQYVPRVRYSPKTSENADAALEQFQKVIDDPKSTADNRLLATQSMASLYFNLKDFPKAEDWNKKVLAADANNKEAYYVLGVIAWTNFVAPDREARIAQGDDSGSSGAAERPQRARRIPPSRPGFVESQRSTGRRLRPESRDEKKALSIDPEYEDAMSYMNLLIRYRGDLEDTKEQYQADAKEADGWISKAMETTKKKAAKKSAAAEQTQ